MRRRRNKTPFRRKLFRILLPFVILAPLILYILGSRNVWDGKSRLTVVMGIQSKGEEGLAVFSLEPVTRRGAYILIRKNFMVDIPYGYKMYPAHSVYKLGQLDERRGGGKLLKSSIETTLGLKTDRYIIIKPPSPEFPRTKSEFSEFKRNFFNILSGAPFFRHIVFNSDSDMSFLEKWRLFNAIRSMQNSDIDIVDLSLSPAALKSEQPDKSEIYQLDSEAFDHLFSDAFQNINVRREEFTLEVQNATGIEKIASQFSRILNQLGAYVILKSTATSELDAKCSIRFNNPKAGNSEIARILTADYGCIEETKNNNIIKRADILVIIGKEFLK